MVIIAILIVARTFFLESSKDAVKQLARIVLVLVVAGLWFPKASEYLNTFNNYSFVLQASIMSSAGDTDGTSALVNGDEKEGDQYGAMHAYEVDNQTGAKKYAKLATNTIRNELFKQTIYKPFLLMNYGTAKASDIDNMYQKVDDKDIPKDTGGEYLLSDDFSKLDKKEKEDIIDKLAGDEKSPNNYYLTADSVGYKFVISLVYLIGVFLYGLPLVAIAFCNVLLQLLAIIFSFILPIIALLSLFPKYGNGLLNSIVTIAKIFMGKALLGLLVLMFALVNTAIDLLIPQDSMVNALLNLFVKGVIYILAIKYRKELLYAVTSALTTGSVSLRGASMNHGMNRNQHQGRMQEQMQAFQNGDYQPSLSVVGYGETSTMEMPSYSEPKDVTPDSTAVDSGSVRDPQAETTAGNQTLVADVPQADINEHISVDDPQADVNEHISVDDPQADVNEHISVDDPQVEVNEHIDVDDPQAQVRVEQVANQNDPTGNQQVHLHQHQGNVSQTNTQQLDVNQTTQNEYKEYHETFESRLEDLRG